MANGFFSMTSARVFYINLWNLTNELLKKSIIYKLISDKANCMLSSTGQLIYITIKLPSRLASNFFLYIKQR